MTRLMLIAAALALLTLPVVAGAGETRIPAEVQWSSTPPARGIVDAGKLTELLVQKGVLTPIEQAQIKQPATAGSTSGDREMDRNHGITIVSQP